MRQIRLSRSPGERRVALLNDGALIAYRCERPARPDGVGDILRGRITAAMPALAGAFVALPPPWGDGETGFLPESECEGRKLPPEGTILTLRVTRAGQGGKGPRLSARTPQSPGGLALIARGPDAALRWATTHPEARIVTDDPAEAARLRAALGHARVLLQPEAFDSELEEEVARLAEPVWELAGGGRLIISPLPALTAVDVDSGGADPREVNARAIAEFARQLRLRDLAGPILLDLAGLSVKQRAALEPELRSACGPDGLTQLLGLGPLGLFELRRARIHPPLHEVLADRALAESLALLRQAMRESAASPSRRLALEAPPRVILALNALPEALAEFTARAGHPLTLRPAASPAITDA
ncbi:ribonuclease E/G [Roseococcus sp. SDR]|uniref:ribonuclease E/G n=1 Tax=Roseococcus sp. SDR TaxID=2835532 RepID=UPI001BCC1427|nr:ribonuclease E/G [Roseococcus sp. SDR]MBS7788599.1 ribonuclease E/G [Roseococcus sp. SDR]MBV1843913.1 ribonuclease E/G [Roseococcus sp. SDR]